LGCNPEYAIEVLEKLKNDGCVKAEDYSEFRVIKEIAKSEELKVRYKEITSRVVVQKSY
jgi:threonyl-tRNA synthetase